VLNLPPSALKVASIALRDPANKKRAVALTDQQFRYGFGNALSATESAELFERWTIPSPGKPLFGRVRELHAAFAREGQYWECDARPAPDHRRRQRPHRSCCNQPLDAEAVPEVTCRDRD